MKKSMIALLLSAFLLNGCHGFSIGYSVPERGYGIGISYSVPETRNIEDEVLYKNKQWLIEKYGYPDKTDKISDVEEILTYNRGLGGSGLMPYVSIFFLFPVPLFVPTHFKWQEYHVYDDIIQLKTARFTKMTNCFIGYGIENESGQPYHWISTCKL